MSGDILGSRNMFFCALTTMDVVYILNIRTSRVPCLMRLLRILLFSTALHSFSFSSQHAPGVSNQLTDALFQLAEFSSFGSRGTAASHSGRSRTPGRVNLSALEQQCHSFLLQGLATSTRRSYASAQAQFISFCPQLGKLHASGSPCPADEWTLCLFSTFLANRIQHSSIKVYLSGVRALHIEQGFPDPLANRLRLQRVVRGIKHCQCSSSSSRLPITDDLMLLI